MKSMALVFSALAMAAAGGAMDSAGLMGPVPNSDPFGGRCRLGCTRSHPKPENTKRKAKRKHQRAQRRANRVR